jgi:6,7-dimethyl-8-ribityllumazine synthase
MSIAMPSRPRQLQARRTIAIVASQYNPEFVTGLTTAAQQELTQLVPDGTVQLYSVPGAFEIPLMVQELAERGTFTAIIALGVIIQGETEHARLIGEAVTRGLMDISLRCKVPVIHEVLLVANEEQARKRCLGAEINRGTEAARTAVRMIQTYIELRGR